MCAVSAISDYYRDTWQQRQLAQPNTPPFAIPNSVPSVFSAMDTETKELLKKAVAILERIDAKLGDVECHDDAKDAFLAELYRP